LAGIYLHIPFCKRACHYCNFHFSTQVVGIEPFVQALQKEIDLTFSNENAKESISTLYFGGGTPSLLSESQLGEILNSISKKCRLEADVEITLEANPDDISKEKLKQWHSLGINRLSLGVQSFSNEELKWMNRAHDARLSQESIDLILASDIDNFSADLIFGSPLMSDRELTDALNWLSSKKIPHLSCYSLTVEQGTALHHAIKQQKSAPADPEKQASQFLLTMDVLEAAGYEQYEISNYALLGKRSRHNSSYWMGLPYYGFGPSAHSFDGVRKRSWNVSNNHTYIRSLQENKIPTEEEVLNEAQQANEFIMTSLRKREGISLAEFEKRFGKKRLELLQKDLKTPLSEENIIDDKGCIKLTRTGKLFADGIAADFFQD
jgi:oxygen-independent coproporphyrinogen-3 oxidase